MSQTIVGGVIIERDQARSSFQRIETAVGRVQFREYHIRSENIQMTVFDLRDQAGEQHSFTSMERTQYAHSTRSHDASLSNDSAQIQPARLAGHVL